MTFGEAEDGYVDSRIDAKIAAQGFGTAAKQPNPLAIDNLNATRQALGGEGVKDAALGGDGMLSIRPQCSTAIPVACWGSTPGAGHLRVAVNSDGSFTVSSSAGATDAGCSFNWVACAQLA